MSSPGQEIQQSNLGDLVRTWVHFDNLTAQFNRQSQQARSARHRSEAQIIEYLKQKNMMNAVIQITGGRITVVEEKHSQALTLQRLEVLLHEYFFQNKVETDKTDAIMKFIKENRETVVETKLKKS
jgi:hypothetical protein